LADVGQLFFKSKSVSLNGQIACRTCHLDDFGSADGLPNAVGILGEGEGPTRALSNGKIIPRNTLPFWGRGAKGFEIFFWDGKVDFSGGKKLSQFGNNPPSDDPLVVAVHLPPVEIREMIADDTGVSLFKQEGRPGADALYRQVVDQLREKEAGAIASLADRLDKPATEIRFLDVARSIAAFIRSEFRLRDTRFHRFVLGNERLSADELAGGLIFYGKGKCVNCHHGPYFSDMAFHAVPLPQLGFGKNGFGVDYGRFNVTFDSADLYRFRTPPLFNVAKTAPYGHAGSVATVSEAIMAHFDPLRGIDVNAMSTVARHEYFKRMAATGDDYKLLSVLSDEEVAQVEIFLRTLDF
jgi:cytochrome c peroxidase